MTGSSGWGGGEGILRLFEVVLCNSCDGVIVVSDMSMKLWSEIQESTAQKCCVYASPFETKVSKLPAM